MDHCQIVSASSIFTSAWTAYPKSFPWQCNSMLLNWQTGHSLKIPHLCPGNENVLNRVKTNLVFHNYSWDFFHYLKAGVTLSPIAAEQACSYICTLSHHWHSGSLLICSKYPLALNPAWVLKVCEEISHRKKHTVNKLIIKYFLIHSNN